jgi:hypothetical protein
VATKAERARSEMERSGPKRAPKAKKRTRRSGPHNAAARVAKKVAAQEEDRPESTTPSRKSSRRGANHIKFGSNLKLRQINRLHAPKARQPSGT